MSSRVSRQDFIRQIVAADVAAGRNGGRVATRFPPEPNGYLHIGHAKAICLDFGVAEEFGGTCNLRMDDTNPETEEPRYVEAIERDVRWLGFEWNGTTRFASDYFELFYRLALQLVRDGKAYVDSLSEEEIREHRGTVTKPGRPSPYRDRSVEENVELFEGMRAGEFPDGACVLRARIDMAHPNMKMRDPLLYRVRHLPHYRTGDAWPIYPMYDWAHPLSDAIEGITHSFCTLEFEVNRELYDWVLDNTRPAVVGLAESEEPGAWDPRPRQYEFARLNLEYTVMSKRKLAQLVREGHVGGWDDPRMPTLAGLRRRGVTPEAVRAFCDLVGVSKAEQRVQIGKLEHAVRDDLNRRAPRVMCVLRPLAVVVENWPEGKTEWLEAPYFPPDVGRPGSRKVPFARELYIESDDFREEPPKGFWRLAPGRQVRLRHGYVIRCTGVERDPETGEVRAVRCVYEPASRGGSAPAGRRIRGTVHWVSARHSLPCEVRLYDRLFSVSDPEAGEGDLRAALNPRSLLTLRESRIEPSVVDDPPQTRYQFERLGYFVRDSVDSRPGNLVFNRTVALRDGRTRREAGRQGDSGRGGAVDAGDPAAGRPEGGRRKAPGLTARGRRYRDELGLSGEEAAILDADRAAAALFEEALAVHPDPRPVANWIVHELRGMVGGRPLSRLGLGGAEVGRLVALVEEGTISRRVGKSLLRRLLEEGGDPRRIVEEEELYRIGDPAFLAPIVDRLLAEHPEEAARCREGHGGLLAFFVGRVMQATGGRADPRLVRELLGERLS